MGRASYVLSIQCFVWSTRRRTAGIREVTRVLHIRHTLLRNLSERSCDLEVEPPSTLDERKLGIYITNDFFVEEHLEKIVGFSVASVRASLTIPPSKGFLPV